MPLLPQQSLSRWSTATGIKALKETFDFSEKRAYAIYAPNGVMKSSFAQAFHDLASGAKSKDRIYGERVTARRIVDEHGNDIAPNTVFVVRPYDEEFGPNEKTSSLLVDQTLRKEYEGPQKGIDRANDALLKALKSVSGSRRDFEQEIAQVFTPSDRDFKKALGRIGPELAERQDSPFADMEYDKIFDEKVLSFLKTDTEAQQRFRGMSNVTTSCLPHRLTSKGEHSITTTQGR